MKITKEQKIFLPSALAFAVISNTGFDVYARLTIGLETFIHALSESVYYSGKQIVGTIWLIAPFLIIGLLSASMAKKDKFRRGWCFFVCGILPLMILYLGGYISEANLLAQKKWTASIFATAFLPFKCIPILLVFQFYLY